jgi:hypothetical protein
MTLTATHFKKAGICMNFGFFYDICAIKTFSYSL